MVNRREGGHVGRAHSLGTETKFHGLSHHKMAKDWRLQVLKKTTCFHPGFASFLLVTLGRFPPRLGFSFCTMGVLSKGHWVPG